MCEYLLGKELVIRQLMHTSADRTAYYGIR